jgi:hypothetical protein
VEDLHFLSRCREHLCDRELTARDTESTISGQYTLGQEGRGRVDLNVLCFQPSPGGRSRTVGARDCL